MSHLSGNESHEDKTSSYFVIHWAPLSIGYFDFCSYYLILWNYINLDGKTEAKTPKYLIILDEHTHLNALVENKGNMIDRVVYLQSTPRAVSPAGPGGLGGKFGFSLVERV